MTQIHIRRLWDGRPARPDEATRLQVSRSGQHVEVSIDAPFHDDRAPAAAPGRHDGLWDFEVVELFLVGAAGHYLELEFGPHGHYLALELSAVRRASNTILSLDFEASVDGGRWGGRARFPRAWLPAGVDRWNAFAIHGEGEARRHLAAHPLPGKQVDFHQPHRFPVGAAGWPAIAVDT